MTTPDRLFWERLNRAAARLSPDLAAKLFRAFKRIGESIPLADLERAVAQGPHAVEALFDDLLLDRQLEPFRQDVREIIQDSVKSFAKDLPRAGRVGGALVVGFDVLNPKVIEAVRGLETKVLANIKDVHVRETVRAFTENGLRDGVNPRAIARDLRQVVGLSPHRMAYIENLRQELTEGRTADASRRRLLDKRFNLARLEALPEGERLKRIEKIVEIYRKRWIAQDAETVARTASLDSMKSGQRLAWEDAIAKGIVERDRLFKKWVNVGDSRVRDEHQDGAMGGEVAPFDQPFSNGEMIPGESTYNCRCSARYFQRAA